MSTTDILDQPEVASQVFNNKTGGGYTTPGLYIGFSIIALAGFVGRRHFIGFFILLFSIPFFLSSSWTAVDLGRRRICSYWRILGIKIGADNWQPLPVVTAVTVIRVKMTQTVASRGSQTTMSDFQYKVKLAGGERKVWDLITTDKKQEALVKAEHIAGALQVKLVDYSEPGKSTVARRR